MPYFNSDAVEVFPSTYREYGNGKFTSESNFTNILRSLTDNNSFVIGKTGNDLEFIIHGYYFKITMNSFPSNMYVCLYVADSDKYISDSTGSTTLDKNGSFLGIEYNSSGEFPEIEGVTTYILKVTDNSGQPTNLMKFVSDSVQYKNHSLTNDLDARQYKLVVDEDSYIEEISNEYVSPNYIRLSEKATRKLDSMISKGDDGSRLVYTNELGELINSRYSVGYKWTNNNNNVYSEQNVRLEGGVVKPGYKVYVTTSDTAPTGASAGDLWFQCEANTGE